MTTFKCKTPIKMLLAQIVSSHIPGHDPCNPPRIDAPYYTTDGHGGPIQCQVKEHGQLGSALYYALNSRFRYHAITKQPSLR